MSAAALGVFVLLEVIAAGVLCIVLGWSWQDALEAFVVTNSAIGLSFGSCGAILAWHRPRNPIGWLFVAGGVAQNSVVSWVTPRKWSRVKVTDVHMRWPVKKDKLYSISIMRRYPSLRN